MARPSPRGSNPHFKSQYVIVVTITTRAGGYARIHRVDDDGTTLTVVAEQVSGGCSGTQQPTRHETFTLLVAPEEPQGARRAAAAPAGPDVSSQSVVTARAFPHARTWLDSAPWIWTSPKSRR